MNDRKQHKREAKGDQPKRYGNVIAAVMKRGLVERIDDPDGGTAKKHKPSSEGLALLKEEFEGRRESASAVMEDWSEQDMASYAAMLRRFNECVERKRGKPWPR